MAQDLGIPNYDQEIERQHEPAVVSEAEPPQYSADDDDTR